MTNKQINLYYQPYDKQKYVHTSNAKYKVLRLGRRSGKTYVAAAEILSKIMKFKGDRKLQIGWIAPSYVVGKRGIDAIERIGRDLLQSKFMHTYKAYPQVIEILGHKITFLSADNPDSIRGYYFDFVVIDEAAYIKDEVFYDVILPTTMDTDADILTLSTPAGKRGFFYNMCLKGIQKDAGYEQFHWTAYDNPYVSSKVIDAMVKELPELAAKQEIYADFIENGEQLVTGLDGCNTKTKCTCKEQHNIMGLDLAKTCDYTVCTSVCLTCNTINDSLRFNKIDWDKQIIKIKNFYDKNNIRKVIVDSTGVGDPIRNQLEIAGLTVEPFKFTNNSKQDIINALIMAIERTKVQWDFDKYPVYANEISTYQPQVTPSGKVTYNAAAGCFDDAVISLALCCKDIMDEYIKPFIVSSTDKKDEIEPLWVEDESEFGDEYDYF
jgi:hypothetical protein